MAKREQIGADAAAFVNGLVQGLTNFVRNSPHASEPCTVAITSIAAAVPGLEQRLRSAGFSRILRLPEGAAACGAACIGDLHATPPSDLAEIQVETGVPLSLARSSHAGDWEARLQKVRLAGQRPSPTHVILDGIGHALGHGGRLRPRGGVAGAADRIAGR